MGFGDVPSGRFHTLRNCSRLLSAEVEFYWQIKQQNRVLCHPLGDLGVTYTILLWLVGKRVVDFLLMTTGNTRASMASRG